ncbi:MAG: RodZ domain-containing protein [Acidobacteriota bacterium]
MPEEAQVDFGAMFRQARERQGLTLQQVAAVTKISARVLDALERNDVSKLPGGIFSRAFVRSYAREIGLDPDMAIERFSTDFPDESGKEQLPSAKEAEDIEAFESGRRAATTVLQVLGLSIVAIAGVVFAMNSRACKTPVAAPPAASAPAQAAPPPVSVAATQTPTPAETTLPPSSAQPTTEPAPSTNEAARPVPAAPAASTTPGPARAPQTPAAIQLGIVAQSDCWLMVKVDSNVVFERVMRVGEQLFYQASASVTMSAGNAGGLVLTINGKPARPLGTSGQVVTATITPGTLASFLQ